VKQRIDFKLAVLVSLHGLTPPYLSDDCQLVTEVGRRHLRSSDVCSAMDTVTDWWQKLRGSWNARGCRTICWSRSDRDTL